jgi:hypothetical protein
MHLWLDFGLVMELWTYEICDIYCDICGFCDIYGVCDIYEMFVKCGDIYIHTHIYIYTYIYIELLPYSWLQNNLFCSHFELR